MAALAAGSGSNGEGVAGIAGEAQLLIVQAGGPTGAFTDVEEAAAIVYAVDHGARILNLSLGGPSTSTTERRAIDYAVSKGALLVAAVGNSYASGNPIEYPAALLQPVGSRGVGGRGLAVAASTRTGARASFSSTGTHVSLAAPGEGVFSAVSGSSPASRYPRVALPGSAGGPLRLRQRHVVRRAAGRRRRSSRLGRQPATAGRRGRIDPGADRVRPGNLDRGARLRRARRRRGGRSGAGSGVHAAAPREREARRIARRARVAGARRRRELPRLRRAGRRARARADAEHDGDERARTRSRRGAATPSRWRLSAPRASSSPSRRRGRSRCGRRPRGSACGRSCLAAPPRAGSSWTPGSPSAGLPGAEGARTLLLESFDGRRWSRAATAVTDSSGRAVWRYALTAGSYRIRARYPGTDEIAPATSKPVTLTLR